MATYKDVLELVDKASKTLRDIENQAGKTTKKVNNLKDTMKKVAGAIAVVGTAIGMISKATLDASKRASDYGDRIDKMSQKIGMSRKAFQEWDYIMSQNGGSVESLQMGFKTLTTQVANASKGNKDSANTFKRLGVNIKDANGKLKTQDEIFNDTVRALQKMGAGIERDAIAQKLFGRSALEMKTILNQEASAVDNLREKANKLGLIITDEDIENAVKFKDTMDTFTRFFDAKFSTMMMKIMPSLEKTTEGIIELTQQNQKVFDDLGASANWITSSVLPAILKGLFWIADAMRTTAGFYGDVLGRIMALPTDIENAFIQAQNIVLRVFIAIKKNSGEAIQFIIQKLVTLLQTISAIASKIPMLKALGAGFGELANNLTRNNVTQTQNNNTTNNSTVIHNNYGNSQRQAIGGMLNPAYVR